MTKKGIESRIKKRLNRFLIDNNFVINEYGSYVSTQDDITLDVTFEIYSTWNEKGNFVIRYGFGIRMNRIESLWENYSRLLDEYRTGVKYTMSFERSAVNPLSDKYPKHIYAKKGGEFIQNEQNVFDYVDTFKIEYNELIIPFVKEKSKLIWIDKQWNEDFMNFKLNPPFSTYGLVFKKLIVAKLVDNPKYEEMYNAFRQRWINWLNGEIGKLTEDDRKMLENNIKVLDKVYEDLNNMNLY